VRLFPLRVFTLETEAEDRGAQLYII